MTLLDRLLLNKLATKKTPTISVHDEYSTSTTEPYSANFVNTEIDKKFKVENNASAHNSIYRGKNITDLFYDGTLSTQIANGTFDDIFIGDYIIGEDSETKYLVADINYRLNTGNTPLTTNHVLMIPEKVMGAGKMNGSDTSTGGYTGSQMYTTNLASAQTTILADFGSSHILSYSNLLTKAVSGGKASDWEWKTRLLDLMSEIMVYGHNAWASNPAFETGIDKTQLSIFRHNASLIMAKNNEDAFTWWWLRDVSSAGAFCLVDRNGYATGPSASASHGIRPAFLIY